MNYGPRPWQQTQWDWRGAANFMCGGAGGGLIVFTALSGARGIEQTILLLIGLALVGLGLLSVWLEIGRPLRAANVFRNPGMSWMSREAIAATLLMPIAFIAAVLLPAAVWLAAVIAVVFIYCQSRMLQAAKGIVAWREPRLVPLNLATGLTEGAGLFWLGAAWHGQGSTPLLILFAALVLIRMLAWRAWRQRLDGRAAKRALEAIDAAGRVLFVAGTLLPLIGIVLAATGFGGVATATALAGAAGLLAALAGAWFKFTLVTRGGFNQGFDLVHLPVRGAR